jgi:hypothetical protein
VRALLGWRGLCGRCLLQKQQGLDGIPLLLGHGLQLGLGPGRNGHMGYILALWRLGPAILACLDFVENLRKDSNKKHNTE